MGQTEVPELDLHRAGAAVQLQGEPTGILRLALLVVVEGGGEDAVDPDLDVRRLGHDAIGRPAVASLQILKTRRRSEPIDPAAPIRRDRNPCATLHQQAASLLVVDPTQPDRAIIQVRLVSRSVPIGPPLRAKLDPRVGRRPPAQPELQFQIKIMHLTVPEEKFVLAQ
jgi:hypothetical protein